MKDHPADPYHARAAICELLERVGTADRAALGQLYELTASSLFGICLRICGERSEAEDVLHEVFQLIWKRAGSFVPTAAHPMAWLGTIARNRSIDWARGHGRRRTRPIEDAGEIADDAPDQLAVLERSQEAQRLYDCLDALDARQRDTLRTAFFGGLTYAQLAEAQGVPEPTVRSWARRGLLNLRGCVSDA
ncbi:sigma-70 family RNA polymerase sigma factor [uncultured Sphingomonas sp.]|uniref:sigma-70 family RNA polymerase sigma factor n=1 Tax=uncultured Sphingomonas sp. TaxID=158754 RepID=UPI0025E2159B|nr:sigma-70 family RNA polymerase sigma factor [uncultured Sphingomonas sp.]